MKQRKTVKIMREEFGDGIAAKSMGRAFVSVKLACLVVVVLTGWYRKQTQNDSAVFEGALSSVDVEGSLVLRRIVDGKPLVPILDESYTSAYIASGTWVGSSYWDAGPRVLFESELGAGEVIEIIHSHGRPGNRIDPRDVSESLFREGYAVGGAEYSLVVTAESDCEPGLTVGCSSGLLAFTTVCSDCG